MNAWLSALGFAASLVALYLSAGALVRGALVLARSLGMSPLVAGMTIVAFGGSAPELAIGVLAAAEGHGALALGNVIGSNIANVALILGLSATIRPLLLRARMLTHEMAFMLGAVCVLLLMGLDGWLGRIDASILSIGFLGFLAVVAGGARGEIAPVEVQYEREVGQLATETGRVLGLGQGSLLAVAGVVGLAVGAHLMVVTTSWLARRLGIGDAFLGLTVVALGTSLPELATSIVAVIRRETDIALGNIVGSNVFNVLAILGISGLVRPIAVGRSLYGLELPALLLFSVALLPAAFTRSRIDRWEGGAFALGYAVFLWLVVLRGLGGAG
jgi:cation:H+ antiporter